MREEKSVSIERTRGREDEKQEQNSQTHDRMTACFLSKFITHTWQPLLHFILCNFFSTPVLFDTTSSVEFTTLFLWNVLLFFAVTQRSCFHVFLWWKVSKIHEDKSKRHDDDHLMGDWEVSYHLTTTTRVHSSSLFDYVTLLLLHFRTPFISFFSCEATKKNRVECLSCILFSISSWSVVWMTQKEELNPMPYGCQRNGSRKTWRQKRGFLLLDSPDVTEGNIMQDILFSYFPYCYHSNTLVVSSHVSA